MNVRKTDEFIADVEAQYQWYFDNAGVEVADHYLDAVQATCHLLSQQPHLGPFGRFAHERLRDWRFFLIFRPFKRHILFYEILNEELIFRRAMHGHRDLRRSLV